MQNSRAKNQSTIEFFNSSTPSMETKIQQKIEKKNILLKEKKAFLEKRIAFLEEQIAKRDKEFKELKDAGKLDKDIEEQLQKLTQNRNEETPKNESRKLTS